MLRFLRFGACIVWFATLPGCLMGNALLPPALLTPEQIQQSVEAFEELRSVQEKVASLVSPIFILNTDLCNKRTVHSLGFEWITINDVPIEIREDAGHFLNLGEIPSIHYVEAGSPAAEAGLRHGDLLLAVNGISIKVDPVQTRRGSHTRGIRPYRKYLSQLLAKSNKKDTLTKIRIQRGEVDRIVGLQTQERCNVQVVVTEDARKELYSKGGTIYLSWGLYKFAQSDAELQALVAHQLAHFIMGHDNKRAPGSSAGGIVGRWAHLGVVAYPALAGIMVSALDGKPEVGARVMAASIVVLIAGAIARGRPSSWPTVTGNDREADYVSTYLLARAGVDVKNAMLIWNRLSKEPDVAQIHRVSESRLKAIDNAIEEVSAKRAANEPLIPNQ